MNSEQQPDSIIIESDSKENKGAKNESGPHFIVSTLIFRGILLYIYVTMTQALLEKPSINIMKKKVVYHGLC